MNLDAELQKVYSESVLIQLKLPKSKQGSLLKKLLSQDDDKKREFIRILQGFEDETKKNNKQAISKMRKLFKRLKDLKKSADSLYKDIHKKADEKDAEKLLDELM
jgi:hypothetical protein